MENKRTCFDCLRLVNTATMYNIFRTFEEAQDEDIVLIPITEGRKMTRWVADDRLAVARDIWEDPARQEYLIEQLRVRGIEFEDSHLDLAPVTPQFDEYVKFRRESAQSWNRNGGIKI